MTGVRCLVLYRRFCIAMRVGIHIGCIFAQAPRPRPELSGAHHHGRFNCDETP
jgi:hypothetical protein